jgi:hypothetical protein
LAAGKAAIVMLSSVALVAVGLAAKQHPAVAMVA